MSNVDHNLGNNVGAAITAFRLGMEGQANDCLTQTIDSLGAVLSGISPDKLSQLTALLPEVLAAQTRQDYLQVADLLEYRLMPLLGLK